MDQAKLNQAISEMEQVTITPSTWCERIEKGYPPGTPYKYQNTHTKKALDLFYEAVKGGNPPQPQPSPGVDPRARFVIFCAQEPQKALSSPQHYCIAFSADFAYRDGVGNVISQAKQAGHRTAGWCDCRVNDGTPASTGVQFVKDFGLDYFIGQAEHDYEFDNAIQAGAEVVIGNITALRGEQIDKIARGDVAFIQEDYWNEGWQRATNSAISQYCAGVYETALWGSGGPTIQAYKDAGRWLDGDGVYHAASVQDWGSLT